MTAAVAVAVAVAVGSAGSDSEVDRKGWRFAVVVVAVCFHRTAMRHPVVAIDSDSDSGSGSDYCSVHQIRTVSAEVARYS